MKKKYITELAKPKTYRLTLFTVDGDFIAEIDIAVLQFLPILRKYNEGFVHAFTEFVLRELNMSARKPGLYYVVVQPKAASWIPYRNGRISPGTSHLSY